MRGKNSTKNTKVQGLHVFGAFVSFVLLAVTGDFLELFFTKLKVKLSSSDAYCPN